jgi:glycosyltransferase involved in cell wall biosynthesis
MGLISLLLKTTYSVPAYFFLHTDWLTFAKKNLGSDLHMVNRIRRILRAFYRQYNYLFVLNRDQQSWLSGKEIGIESARIFKTAHWVDEKFAPKRAAPQKIFKTQKNEKILLFVGRVSREKGVMDLPFLYEAVKREIPEVRLAVVGSGPAELELKEKIADLIHIPWVEHERLPEIYSSADLLLLPSTFDTFGLVILEALSCGLPVAAYNIMGPGEIIENGVSGYLAKSKRALVGMIVKHLAGDAAKSLRMRRKAVKRAQKYHRDNIMKLLLRDLDLLQ